jgi:hypothetical protein
MPRTDSGKLPTSTQHPIPSGDSREVRTLLSRSFFRALCIHAGG